MPANELSQRHAFAEGIAREAGWVARRYFDDRSTLQTSMKGAQDFLTVADGEVEALLRRRVAEAFPDDGFLGEEGGGAAARMLWVVDPIDGTSNFARGEPHWCVSIGFLVDDVPEIGVIEVPLLRETFSARRGRGATCNGEAITVATTADMRMAAIEIGWSTRRSIEDYLRLVEGVMRAGAAAKRSASGALGICWAAAGRTDGYVEAHINSWDVAAGLVIAAEAGAAVNDFFADDGLATGNPVLVAAPALAPHLADMMGVRVKPRRQAPD